MLDLLIRNATLPDGRTGIDIAIRDGRIAEVAPGIEAPARETPWPSTAGSSPRPSSTPTSISIRP